MVTKKRTANIHLRPTYGMAILDSIKNPTDLKALKESDLPVLAAEIREKIIQTTSKCQASISNCIIDPRK